MDPHPSGKAYIFLQTIFINEMFGFLFAVSAQDIFNSNDRMQDRGVGSKRVTVVDHF